MIYIVASWTTYSLKLQWCMVTLGCGLADDAGIHRFLSFNLRYFFLHCLSLKQVVGLWSPHAISIQKYLCSYFFIFIRWVRSWNPEADWSRCPSPSLTSALGSTGSRSTAGRWSGGACLHLRPPTPSHIISIGWRKESPCRANSQARLPGRWATVRPTAMLRYPTTGTISWVVSHCEDQTDHCFLEISIFWVFFVFIEKCHTLSSVAFSLSLWWSSIPLPCLRFQCMGCMIHTDTMQRFALMERMNFNGACFFIDDTVLASDEQLLARS